MYSIDILEVLQDSPQFVNDHFEWYNEHKENPHALYGNTDTVLVFARSLTLSQFTMYVADSSSPIDVSFDLVVNVLTI